MNNSAKFVLIAGPNPVEVVTTNDLPEIFQQFSADEIGLWERTADGVLAPVTFETRFQASDERFNYYTTQLNSGQGNYLIEWDSQWVA